MLRENSRREGECGSMRARLIRGRLALLRRTQTIRNVKIIQEQCDSEEHMARNIQEIIKANMMEW